MWNRIRIPITLVFLYFLQGCNPAWRDENTLPPQSLDEAIEAHEAELSSEAWRPLLNSGIQIGRMEGGLDSIFGMIRDLTFGPDDAVFVLDDRLIQIKAFKSSGEIFASVGRGGRGPGEYFIPASISVTPGGSVYVLDGGNLRITVYQIGATSLEISREIPIPFPADDLCVTDDERMFLLGYFKDQTIHEISKEGLVRSSFAPAPAADDFEGTPWLLRVKQEYANGFLACPTGTDLLVFLSKHFGYLRAFRMDGSLAWEHRLEGFHGLTLRQTERGTLQFAPADGNLATAETAGGLVSVPGEVIAVQFGVPRPGTDNDFSSIETRFLRLLDGSEVSRRLDLPRLGGLHGDLVMAFENSPYPRISLFRDSIPVRY